MSCETCGFLRSQYRHMQAQAQAQARTRAHTPRTSTTVQLYNAVATSTPLTSASHHPYPPSSSPLGYMTLRVYRATLPYDAIKTMQTRQVVLTTKVALVGFEDVKDAAIVSAIKSQVVATLASHGIHGLVSTSSVSERFALKSPAGVDDNSAWTNLVTDSEAGLKAHRCGYQAQAQTSGSKDGVAVSQHTAERQHIEAILSSAKAMSTPDEYVQPNFNCS